MNDVIKEILDNVRKCCDITKDHSFVIYQRQDILKLLDYITNLQEENERLQKQLEYLRTDEYLNQVKWERNFNETMNKELKTRIEKAVEYINNGSYFDGSSMCKVDLLNILNGRNDK